MKRLLDTALVKGFGLSLGTMLLTFIISSVFILITGLLSSNVVMMFSDLFCKLIDNWRELLGFYILYSIGFSLLIISESKN
jgi:hypothetical protein